jgi:hypothetical protein
VVQGGFRSGEMQMEVELVGVQSGEVQRDVDVLSTLAIEVQGDVAVVSMLKFEVQSGVESVDITGILTPEVLSLNDFQMRRGIFGFEGS